MAYTLADNKIRSEKVQFNVGRITSMAASDTVTIPIAAKNIIQIRYSKDGATATSLIGAAADAATVVGAAAIVVASTGATVIDYIVEYVRGAGDQRSLKFAGQAPSSSSSSSSSSAHVASSSSSSS